tara:strand:- start:31 stop:357 length:327 start_codon:yes stop_codon:yes gene_type:complete
MSEDLSKSAAKKKQQDPPPMAPINPARMKRMNAFAGSLMSDLFGEAANIPGARIPGERQADALFDKSGFFDPGRGSLQERSNLALAEWYKHLGLGPYAYEQSPFYRRR